MRKRKPRLSPYKRMEAELAANREALGEAATAYAVTLQALMDLLALYDHPPSGWTHADVRAIRAIRAIADGNGADYPCKK